MKIKQLSLFVENKPGELNKICKVLAANNINLSTLNLADTEQFGILRLLIKEWEKAQEILEQAGFVVRVTDVVALPVEDEAGGLHKMLESLEHYDLSVEYMYAFAVGATGKAVMVFRFEEIDRAIECLTSGGFDVVNPVDIF